MCEIAKYPELYSNARGVIREAGISPEIPGYELLIRAAVQYKVEGSIKNLSFKRNVSIPFNKDVKKHRSSTMQWMIEAAKSAGIKESGKGQIYVENVVKRFAKNI